MPQSVAFQDPVQNLIQQVITNEYTISLGSVFPNMTDQELTNSLRSVFANNEFYWDYSRALTKEMIASLIEAISKHHQLMHWTKSNKSDLIPSLESIKKDMESGYAPCLIELPEENSVKIMSTDAETTNCIRMVSFADKKQHEAETIEELNGQVVQLHQQLSAAYQKAFTSAYQQPPKKSKLFSFFCCASSVTTIPLQELTLSEIVSLIEEPDNKAIQVATKLGWFERDNKVFKQIKEELPTAPVACL